MSAKSDDSYAEILALYTGTLASFALGDLEDMRRKSEAILPSAERLRDRFWLAGALRCKESVSRLEGNWDTARDLNDQGLAIAALEPRSLCNRALLEYESGDFVKGEVYLARLLELMRSTPEGPSLEYAYSAAVILLVARITGNNDRTDIAREAAQKVISFPYVTPYVGALARAGLGLLAVSQANDSEAEAQYAELKHTAGTMLLFPTIAGDRLLALLAQTMGDMETSQSHFEDSLTFCRKAGYRPELAWTCCDYADLLLDPSTSAGRADSDNRTKANAMLDESLAISSELGMRPLLERVLSRREILKA